MLQATWCYMRGTVAHSFATRKSTRAAQSAVAVVGYRGSSRRIIPRSVVLKASVAIDP